MEYGVSDTGFRLPSYADLDASLRQSATNSFRAVLGASSTWTLTWDNTNPVTVFYRVLESEIYRLWNVAESIYYAGSPYTATGDALDLLVGEHGITRRPAQRAVGIVGLRALGGGGGKLPSGTRLISRSGVEFELVEDVEVGAAWRDVWVRAVEPGTAGNVGPGAIVAVAGPYKDIEVDSGFHETTLTTGDVSNTAFPVPKGSTHHYQILRAADIAHPHRISEIRLWVANEAGDFTPRQYRIAVALVDDMTGKEIYRSSEIAVTLTRHERQRLRWAGLNWDIGYGYKNLRLAVLNSAESDDVLWVLGNTMNPYPGCYWHADGEPQEGQAALFEIVSTRPGGTWGGAERESDAELRIRFLNTKAVGAAGHIEAIKAAVWKVPGVRAVQVYQNRESVEVDGLPPHSVRVVAEGGDTVEIAYALLRSVPAGIRLHGYQTVQVTDAYGQRHDIAFDRPTVVNIHVRVKVRRGTGFGTATVQAIKDAVVRAIGGYTSDGAYHTQGIGATVSIAKITNHVLSVSGVEDIAELLIRTENGNWVRDNIVLAPDQIAVCSLEDVEVTWL